MIADLANSGAMPALEKVLQFSAQRQRWIAHNVANIDTPDFRPMDVSVRGFQEQLRRAVEDRRARTGGAHGELRMEGTEEVEVEGGRLTLHPSTSAGNVLFHDRNNRSLERLMQANAENVSAFRVAADLLRVRNDQLRSAMAQRV